LPHSRSSGGFAEVAVAPAHLTFRLPEALDFAQGAGLVLNYHTAVFALVTRGRLSAGEHVLPFAPPAPFSARTLHRPLPDGIDRCARLYADSGCGGRETPRGSEAPSVLVAAGRRRRA